VPLPKGAKGQIANFSGTACPASGQCVISANFVDSEFDSHGLILTQSANGWSPEAVHLPPSLPASTWNDLSALSCPSVGQCFIGGRYGPQPSQPPVGYARPGNALVPPLPSRPAASGPRGTPMAAAVQSQAFLLHRVGVAWQLSFPAGAARRVTHPPSLLACGTDAGCVGLWGTELVYGQTIQDTSSLWSTGAGHEQEVDALACSQSRCFVGGQHWSRERATPLIAGSSGGPWREAPASLPPGNGIAGAIQLTHVSCASASWCVAIGQLGWYSDQVGPLVATTMSGDGWSSRRLLVPGFPQATISAISCAAESRCVAVGTSQAYKAGGSLLLTERPGGWRASSAPLPPDAQSRGRVALDAISCVSPLRCVATGSYEGKTNQNGLLLTDTQGVWSATSAPRPTVSQAWGNDVSIDDVSCGQPLHCVAVGSYGNSDEPPRGNLIWSQTTNGWTVINAPPASSGRYPNPTDPLLVGVSCPPRGECALAGRFYTGAPQCGAPAWVWARVAVHGHPWPAWIPLEPRCRAGRGFLPVLHLVCGHGDG